MGNGSRGADGVRRYYGSRARRAVVPVGNIAATGDVEVRRLREMLDSRVGDRVKDAATFRSVTEEVRAVLRPFPDAAIAEFTLRSSEATHRPAARDAGEVRTWRVFATAGARELLDRRAAEALDARNWDADGVFRVRGLVPTVANRWGDPVPADVPVAYRVARGRGVRDRAVGVTAIGMKGEEVPIVAPRPATAPTVAAMHLSSDSVANTVLRLLGAP
jgi:hypothetical protein